MVSQGIQARIAAIVALAILGVAIAALVPPVRQNPAYHLFADQRALDGIPNFMNVLSNAGFAVAGVLGLWIVLRGGPGQARTLVLLGYASFFGATVLISAGSAWYHWAPDNSTLVWDRLPMSLAFMSFLAVMIGERIGPRAGRLLLLPLLAAGAGSIVYWQVTGDLRPYGVVQFLPLLLVAAMVALFPARYTRSGDLVVALGLYGAAKLAELFDGAILRFTRVSGHTIKHLAAAGAIYMVARMVKLRRPL